jgi:hypothetical protein
VFGKVKCEDAEEDYYKILYVLVSLSFSYLYDSFLYSILQVRCTDKALNNAVATRVELIYQMVKTPPAKIEVSIYLFFSSQNFFCLLLI